MSELLARSGIDPQLIEQLVFGQVVQMPEAPNIAREIVLGTGMSVHTDAYSVSRACATSFQAIANVAESIMAGSISVGIAGGRTLLPSCRLASARRWRARWWTSTRRARCRSVSSCSAG